MVDRHRRSLAPRRWRVPRWRVLPWRRAPRGAPPEASAESWAWLEPYPGPFTGPPTPSMSLAFVAALQRLPPDERAALVLSDVLDFAAAEVAEILECDQAALALLLTRARASVADVLPRPVPEPRPAADSASSAPQEAAPAVPAPDEDAVAVSFAAAFDRGDVPAITELLTDNAWLRMRPLPVEYQGRAAAGYFIAAVAFPGGTTRYRLVATRANGQPAFGCYLRDRAAGIDHACGLVVLTVDHGRITAIDRFVDNSPLPSFGLPRTLPAD